MSDIGYPVPIKYVSSLAFIIACQHSTTDEAIKPPGKNWAKALENRHPVLNEKSQGVGLEPSREKHLWEDHALV